MSNEIFDFPFHRVQTAYPEGASVQFGNNWVFTSKPNAPDKRVFDLSFPQGMKYFFVSAQNVTRGDIVTPEGLILNAQRPRTSLNASPSKNEQLGQRNMLAIELFYQRHQQWDTFLYPHVTHGSIRVRFSQPLTVPNLVLGGNGMLEEFSVQLREF